MRNKMVPMVDLIDFRGLRKPDGKRNGRVEVYRDAKGEIRARRVSRNGRVVVETSEGYRDIKSCWRAARYMMS